MIDARDEKLLFANAKIIGNNFSDITGLTFTFRYVFAVDDKLTLHAFQRDNKNFTEFKYEDSLSSGINE